MNHKLRVLVRVDVDPAHVTLEVTGCVTQSDSAALLHIVRRACRLGAGAEVIIDLHGTSHLDPEVLLDLRRLADAGPLPAPGRRGLRPRPCRSGSPSTSRPSCPSASCTSAPTPKSSPDSTPIRPAQSPSRPDSEPAGLLDVGPAPDSTPGWGMPTARWPRKPAASMTLAPSTGWRFRSTSRARWILPPRSGPCPTPRCAGSPTPCTATSTPAARHSERTPGTSSRPKSCRTATWRTPADGPATEDELAPDTALA